MRQGDQTKICNVKRDIFKNKENSTQIKHHPINTTGGTGMLRVVSSKVWN